MSNLFYIYALKDPRSSPARPFYVGKGLGTRAWDHIVRKDETSKGRRIAAIQAAGREVVTTILADGLTEAQALKLTDEATLDLTDKWLSDIKVASTNTTGTIFTVNNVYVAGQVIGGPGDDILNAPTVTLTQPQRDAIFATGSLEIIRDATGFYGNSAANTITGTSAGEALSGGGGDDRLIGGAGADTLTGGPGADTVVYALPSEGVDTILDFASGADRIEIAVAGFGGGLAAGALAANRLVVAAGHVADQAFGQLLYDTAEQALYFDDDGTGANAAVKIATLPGAGSIAAGDFLLV